MIALRIIATVVLALGAILLFFKNIKVYEEDKPVIIFSIIDLLLFVFIGLVVWNVL